MKSLALKTRLMAIIERLYEKMDKTLSLLHLRFPEIRLLQRDAHKLRGYFGEVFREHSPLLHNHYEDGTARYGYPLVQYKVLRGVPTLVGIEEGGRLLAELFFKIKELRIDGHRFDVFERDIRLQKVPIGVSETLNQYRFDTMWMALNAENYAAYLTEDEHTRSEHLSRILIGNILSFYKGVGLRLEPEQRLIAIPKLQETRTQFKNQAMAAFTGGFITNALLPDGVGLGKSVARGFGAVRSVAAAGTQHS